MCAGQLENIVKELTLCGIILTKLKSYTLPNPIIFILESVQVINQIKSSCDIFLEDGNILLDKFAETSHSSLPENNTDDFLNHDPGSQNSIHTTSQRQQLITLGPHQPKLLRYPINVNIDKGKQRTFNQNWYNEYPLIEYS